METTELSYCYFFIEKLDSEAKLRNITFTETDKNLLVTQMSVSTGQPEPIDKLKNDRDYMEKLSDLEYIKTLNNKVIDLLNSLLSKELKATTDVETIRLSMFKSLKMPKDWYTAYMFIYNNSNRFLNGILQNFVISNPWGK